MKKIVNIALDIETLSTHPTAAIIGIAAKAFSLGENKVVEESSYFNAVDATSCVMHGLDIDPDTVKWWSEQKEATKEQYKTSCSIWYALGGLGIFIDKVKSANGADDVMIWCQGTDFDIAILRNAFIKVNNDRAERTVPWNYRNVRDARTYILEGMRYIAPSVEDPYSVIPKDPNWEQHNALSDCDHLIHNVTWVNEKLDAIFADNETGCYL